MLFPSTATASASSLRHGPSDKVAGSFFTHNSAHRVNTDAYIYDQIHARHPDLTLTVVPEFNANLCAYASANPGIASVRPVNGEDSPTATSDSTSDPGEAQHEWPSSLKWTLYVPPASRIPGSSGSGHIAQETFYDSFIYTYKSFQFFVYLVDGRDGTDSYPQIRNQYILSASQAPVYAMVKDVGDWSSTLHGEIWVFNQGYWQKDSSLYLAIQKSRWEDVILPTDLKHDLMDVSARFFSDKTRETYHRLRVPWKRGIIFYGPPGNGKTISIKATMHTLYSLSTPVPTLYVKSLASFVGPEYSINQIFEKARSNAPCYLVFEDLDSLVTPQVRSFFLNAVDGVSENEGILMVGSTNHLEQLDEGISKRPSRFDRKYEFGLPDQDMRRRYCEFWQGKLSADSKARSTNKEVEGDNDQGEIDFPDVLVDKIANITGGFSFAYMQEAFVSTLLIIAGRAEEGDATYSILARTAEADVEDVREGFEVVDLGDSKLVQVQSDNDKKDPLDKYVLWKEMKVQVALLKKEIGK